MSAFPCLKCRRWKLFGDRPCDVHPDFKTGQEIAQEELCRKIDEAMKVLMYTAGLRTTAAMGRPDLLENLNRNLSLESEDVQARVTAEVERLGLMTSEEVVDSILRALELRRRA